MDTLKEMYESVVDDGIVKKLIDMTKIDIGKYRKKVEDKLERGGQFLKNKRGFTVSIFPRDEATIEFIDFKTKDVAKRVTFVPTFNLKKDSKKIDLIINDFISQK